MPHQAGITPQAGDKRGGPHNCDCSGIWPIARRNRRAHSPQLERGIPVPAPCKTRRGAALLRGHHRAAWRGLRWLAAVVGTANGIHAYGFRSIKWRLRGGAIYRPGAQLESGRAYGQPATCISMTLVTKIISYILKGDSCPAIHIAMRATANTKVL